MCHNVELLSAGKYKRGGLGVALTPAEALLKVDFGHPDGTHDHNLNNYFYDRDVWSNIITRDKCFVIGRKGTGKSALCIWIKSQEKEKGILVTNLKFQNFPFNRFLNLSDDEFARPNQYRSMWKYIILCEFAVQIYQDQSNDDDSSERREIDNFVETMFGRDTSELHTVITEEAKKDGAKVVVKPFTLSATRELKRAEIGEWNNIVQINERLESLLINIFQRTNRQYLIQFDQLDDNYNLYRDNTKYFEALISLFKVIYDLNGEISRVSSQAKVIAYLRSDIYAQFSRHDADSAKFEYASYKLHWRERSGRNRDYYYPPLQKLIDLRIRHSLPSGAGITFENIFAPIHNTDPFRYMRHRTLHRPRDMIQLCVKVQKMTGEIGILSSETFAAAEKSYSLWLKDELINEVAPIVPETHLLFEMLKNAGKFFSHSEFNEMLNGSRYKQVHDSCEELLRYLYELGIIVHWEISSPNERLRMYSAAQDPGSAYNPNLYCAVHPGLQKGLYIN